MPGDNIMPGDNTMPENVVEYLTGVFDSTLENLLHNQSRCQQR